MKLSTLVSVSDIISLRETVLERAINKIITPKNRHGMYQTELVNTILSSFKKAGIEGMELLIPLLTSDKDIQQVQDIMRVNAMPVLSIHQSLNSFRNITLNEITRLCSIANIFGSKIIVIHAEALAEKLFDQSFIASLKYLQKKHNITFGVENTPKTPFAPFKKYLFKTKEFTNVITQAGLAITFDTTHLAQAGDDITAFYSLNREIIVNIHLSDYETHWLNKKLLLHSHTHLPLTKGELPIREFLTILKKTHYNGLITLEIDANLIGLCESARLIRNIWGK